MPRPKSPPGPPTPSTPKRPAAARAKTSAAPRGRRGPSAAADRLPALLEGLRQLYPSVTCALDHADPYQLLVATILSAQCTDERVNQVTPALFAQFPDPAHLAEAEPETLEALIHSTGFFRNKARSLLGAARRLVQVYGGEIPRTLEELTTLPGVARKTANVVLGTAYGIPSGVVVDTHVKRIAGRLGLTTETDPTKVERDLMALLPREEWIDFSHRVIWHGRRLCKARKPLCEECPLAPHCPAATI